MTNQPKILMFGRHFRPAVTAGGSARSMTNLVENLGGEFDFWVVCRDRDLGADAPFDLPHDQWIRADDCNVHYCRPRRTYFRLFARLMRSQKWAVIYVNSYVSPIFSVVIRLLHRLGFAGDVPLVVAPRGEFAASALKLSATKKRTLLALGKVFGFHRKIIWQASCEHERDDIVRVINPPKERLLTAPDLSPLDVLQVSEAGRIAKEPGELTLALVARIAPIKNILFAIEVLAQCSARITYNLYGPIEDHDYWVECKAAIARLPANITVHYHGSVDRETVPQVLVGSHAFFMPTFGENFGHSILEALAASVPVIISDQTLWQQLDRRYAGFDLPLDKPEDFTAALDRLAAMDEQEFGFWRQGSRAIALDWVKNSEVVEANRKLFARAIEIDAQRI